MLGHVRRHAIGYLALFVALGGTSYAAVRLPANSVGTRQLKPKAVTWTRIAPGAVTPTRLKWRAVTNSKIAPGAVNGSRVKDGSLSGHDLAPDSVSGAQIDESSLGVVPDSDRLGNIPPSGYVQGTGRVLSIRKSDAPGGATVNLLNAAGWPRIIGRCDSTGRFSILAAGDAGQSGTYDVRAASGTSLEGSPVPAGTAAQIPILTGASTDAPLLVSAAGQASSTALRIVSLQGVVAWSGGGCDFRLQALTTTAAS